jgi:Domain of unknown function (DUF5615)
MPPRTQYHRLNEHFNIKHVSHDYNKGGSPDEEVYKMACEQRRIIITINLDDFDKLVGSKDDCGVIAIPDEPTAIPEPTRNSSRFSCDTAPITSGGAWFRLVQQR